MIKIRKLRTITSLFIPLLLAGLLTFSGCSDKQSGPTPPDFSTVPEPYDTTGAKKVVTDDNLTYYIIKEGSGPFEVVSRDQIEVHFTGRVKSTGKVFDSSYKNGSMQPSVFSLPNNIEGFREGVIGMKIGEKRKIIVPPELGYQSGNSNLQGKTLIFDVKLMNIL